jgi:methionine synthase II (cobalamin-independent)
MNINELFEKLQDKSLSEDTNGEFSIHGNCIIWEYCYEEYNDNVSIPIFEDYDEQYFDFETGTPEENMLETYNEILEQLQLYLDELDELENWVISEPDIVDNTISIKIF